MGDGQYGVLVIVKDIHARISLLRRIDRDIKLTVRYFQMQKGVMLTDTSSEVEVDDEVTVNLSLLLYYKHRMVLRINVLTNTVM